MISPTVAHWFVCWQSSCQNVFAPYIAAETPTITSRQDSQKNTENLLIYIYIFFEELIVLLEFKNKLTIIKLEFNALAGWTATHFYIYFIYK